MGKQIRRTLIILVMAACALAFVPAAGDQPALAASKKPAKVAGVSIKVNCQPSASLQWKAVSKNADGYVVYRNGKKLAKVKKGVTAYVDHSLKPGVSYAYTVKAYKKGKKTLYGKASSAKKIVKGFTYGKASDGKAKVTGYTGNKKVLKIPASYKGKKVTEIGTEAFQGNLWIEKLTIPENVKAIDDYAFEACSGVKKIYFPDSLRTIGKGAFSGCGQLRLADLSDKVTSIDDGAFLYCIDLAYIELPRDLQRLGQFVFAGSGIRSVNFDADRLTELPDRTFCNCVNLTAIKIPASIKAIGKRAFSNCLNLRQVEMEKSGVRIDEDAFEKCPEYKMDDDEDEGESDGVMTAAEQTEPGSDGTVPEGGDGNTEVPPITEPLPFTPADPTKTIFREADYQSYHEIHDTYDAWVEKYIQYNSGNIRPEAEYNTYLKMYTGNDHYCQMKAALNGDEERIRQSIDLSGEDYKPMYLMMDHGLSAELMRGKMPEDLILYSGITNDQVAAFAGYPMGQRTGVKVTTEDLVARIGQEVTDEAFISTTASFATAFSFSLTSNVVVKIYASKEAMERHGAVCVSPFSSFKDEEETLLNSFAHYRILDVGTTGIKFKDGDREEVENRTYITLELL